MRVAYNNALTNHGHPERSEGSQCLTKKACITMKYR
jgi:hypothetical protein